MNTGKNGGLKTAGKDGGGIPLADISRFRGELMGLAMLFIILFHVWVRRDDPFYGLHRCGNVGVDMFLFLSGVGLWFAWTRHPDTRLFYARRFARIFPAWLVMACLFYVPDFLGSGRYSSSVGDLIGDVTLNLGFWEHDELTFWYIPAIMALYIAAPPYMWLVSRLPVYRWLPVLLLARMLRRTPGWMNAALRTVGALSLECYLIHSNFVLVHIHHMHLGYWQTFLLTTAITVPAAWLLQRMVSPVVRMLTPAKGGQHT